MRWQLLAPLGLVLLAGCSGLGGALGGESAEGSWEHRIVVENGYGETQTVTVTVDTDSGGVVNETQEVDPDERWVVTTLSNGTSDGNYSVTVSTTRHGDEVTHEGQVGGGSGATRVVVGEGTVASCSGNVTCYE